MPELDDVVDRGQMSLFSDLSPQYATSQRIKDALAPFRNTWTFTAFDTISGVIPIPSNLNYLVFLDAFVGYNISGHFRYNSLELINEDERSARLNSQIDPVTVTSPIAEMIGKGYIRIYPSTSYTGELTFLRRPAKPYFAYTTISDRVIVYDATASTQLEWPEDWQNAVLLKSLETLGINLSATDISQFAEAKTMQNFSNTNRT